jgi:hypothetical protein
MADLVVDEHAALDMRLNAAKELAQYIAPKLKAVEHSGGMEHEVKLIVHKYGKSESA